MAETFTRVRVVGMPAGSGLMDRGRRTRAEMIKFLRDKAQRDLEEAQRILNATDGMFEVAVIQGCIVQRNPEIL